MWFFKKKNGNEKLVEDVENKVISQEIKLVPENKIENKIKECAKWGMSRDFALKFLLEKGEINQELDKADLQYLCRLGPLTKTIFIEQLEKRGSLDDWLYFFERNGKYDNFSKKGSYVVEQISSKFLNELEDYFKIIKKDYFLWSGFLENRERFV